MTISMLSMGLPVIDESLQQIISALNAQTPHSLGSLTGLARVIGQICALCAGAYECWIMMLGRRCIDIFKIFRIIGISLCIASSGVICSALALPGKGLERTTHGMAKGMNKRVAQEEIRVAKLQDKYYQKIRALQDSIEVAKRIESIGEDAKWYEKITYTITHLGGTIDNFAKRATITMETKITEWVNLVIRFIGECIFQIAYFSLLIMQSVFMKILAMFAPIAFALSLAPPWSNAWSQWVSKYLTISLWGFVIYLFVFYADFIILYTLRKDVVAYTALIGKATGNWGEIGTLGMQGIGSTCMYFVGMCVGAVLLKSTPEVCSWLVPGGVSSSSAGNAGASMISSAGVAAGITATTASYFSSSVSSIGNLGSLNAAGNPPPSTPGNVPFTTPSSSKTTP